MSISASDIQAEISEILKENSPSKPLNEPTVFGLSIEFLIGYVTAAAILWYLCRTLLIDGVVYLSDSRRHGWKNIKNLNRACYCSICEILLPPSIGLLCDSCGVCAHPQCLKKADKKLRCKERFIKDGAETTEHLWVKGNLPLNCECRLCQENIDYQASPGLFGYRCCWCQRAYHTICFKKLQNLRLINALDTDTTSNTSSISLISDDTTSDEGDKLDNLDDLNKVDTHVVGENIIKGMDECDFGFYKEMIIPPTSIIALRKHRSIKLCLESIKPPNWDNWKPLIVIANTKSGSNTASEVVSLLRGILHPIQVMELGSKGPQEPLKLALKIMPKPTRILIAGGDGTVGWILNTIFSLGIQPLPEVSIMPLGTGNDLSRVMGWGSKPPSTVDPYKILENIKNSKCINLDRWTMEIEKTARYMLPIQRDPIKTLYVYNYFSIGVDALVTLNFHKTREGPFYLLSSRVINKLLYFIFGMQQILERDCENIENRVEIYLDDKLIELPELQSIIFLNIDSWGAGVKLCKLSETEHSMSDGIMEVFGIVSSFHIAQLQVGISKPIRLGRAKSIRIRMCHPCPVQADGEPWLQSPCEIRLQAKSQAKLLCCP